MQKIRITSNQDYLSPKGKITTLLNYSGHVPLTLRKTKQTFTRSKIKYLPSNQTQSKPKKIYGEKKTITKQNETNYYFYGKFNKVENSKYSLSSLKISSSAHHALQYLEISVIASSPRPPFRPHISKVGAFPLLEGNELEIWGRTNKCEGELVIPDGRTRG